MFERLKLSASIVKRAVADLLQTWRPLLVDVDGFCALCGELPCEGHMTTHHPIDGEGVVVDLEAGWPRPAGTHAKAWQDYTRVPSPPQIGMWIDWAESTPMPDDADLFGMGLTREDIEGMPWAHVVPPGVDANTEIERVIAVGTDVDAEVHRMFEARRYGDAAVRHFGETDEAFRERLRAMLVQPKLPRFECINCGKPLPTDHGRCGSCG